MITLTDDNRYARQELITWWDQDRLRSSRVLVVGAGALGNEIVKNLALLGVGRIEIVDMDSIEASNLARCAMFRDEDQGRAKAEVLAAAAARLNPEVTTVAHVRSVMTLGLGHVAGFDLVIAGLDNREARLWIGQATRKLGIPWVDGAIEGLRGLARVFLEEGPCYECTLGEVDRSIMAARKSCALLSREEMVGGKVPTNSTTASLVAAVQVQEAVKILVGRRDLLALRNQAWVYTGDTLDSYTTGYTEDEWCNSHDRYEIVLERAASSVSSLEALMESVLADDAGLDRIEAIDLEPELVTGRRCMECGWRDDTVRPLADFGPGDGECTHCDHTLTVEAGRSFKTDDPITTLPLSELHLPADDIVTLRRGDTRTHILLRSR